MRIALYGGAFNPPHLGHYKLVRYLLRGGMFDRIMVMPTAVPPHKTLSYDMPFNHRLRMCRDLFRDLPGITVSDIESRLPAPSYTVQTLRAVMNSTDRFSLIIGEDQARDFPAWKNADTIRQMVSVLVFRRTAGNNADDIGPGFTVLNNPGFPGKSSQIRDDLARGCYPLDLHVDTFRYIRDSGLYGLSDGLIPAVRCFLEGWFTPKRFRHTIGVYDVACEAADRYGLSSRRVGLAALFHDIGKNIPEEDVAAWAGRHYDRILACLNGAHTLLHPFFGAAMLRSRFGLHDPLILNAVRHHTLGKDMMDKPAKIVYLADYCEPNRRHASAPAVRELMMSDLDGALCRVLREQRAYLTEKGLHWRSDRLWSLVCDS
jgi:nicotinate-nucleotide adenylyltransferase